MDSNFCYSVSKVIEIVVSEIDLLHLLFTVQSSLPLLGPVSRMGKPEFATIDYKE
jgi:hypothetical protein